MSVNIIMNALLDQGVTGTLRGDVPSDPSQVTQAFLDEKFEVVTGSINVAQLQTDYAEALKDSEKERIDKERDERLNSLTIDLDGMTFDADEKARANITSTVTAINAGVIPVPDPINWRDHNNVTQSLSHLKLLELAGIAFAAVDAIYDTSWDLKAQIDSAPDIATAQTITWS